MRKTHSILLALLLLMNIFASCKNEETYAEQKEKEYKEVLMYLNKGYSIRVTSKLTKVSVATIQRLKNEFIRSA